jgi:three-Cys-motif partner protein
MATPVTSGSSHTAVKRELLVRYLDAWTPTVLHTSHRVTYAEGYAGAGIEPGREDGSPGAALRVFGEFLDRMAGRELAMVLVDSDHQRLDALAGRLADGVTDLGAPTELTVHTSAGDLVPALSEAGSLAGPVLTYLDAAHAPVPPFDIIAAVTKHRASEVLVLLDPGALTEVAAGPREAGDAAFGGPAWREAGEQAYPALVTRYRESLRRAGLSSVLHAELVDGGGAAQLLFFGTRSEKHLDKFKTELWSVDEYAGVRYRDPRDAEHELLDISDPPPIAPLRRALLEHIVDNRAVDVAGLRKHAVAETMYRSADATHALSALLSSGAVAREPEAGRLAADTVLRPA